MSINRKPRRKVDPNTERDYRRAMLRSAFASLFWSAIVEKRKKGRFTLQALADALGRDKSAISRWFSSSKTPNWRVDTISDIADALDIEVQLRARDRGNREIYTPSGAIVHQAHVGGQKSKRHLVLDRQA